MVQFCHLRVINFKYAKDPFITHVEYHMFMHLDPNNTNISAAMKNESVIALPNLDGIPDMDLK